MAGDTVFRYPQYSVEGFLPGCLSWRDPAHAGTSALLVSLPPPGVAGATVLQAAASSNEVWPAFLGSGLHMAAHEQNGPGVLIAAMPDTGCACAIAGLTLSLGGFGAFDLSRGSWFSADLLDDDATALPAHAPDFFSASGALSTLPFKAVIGYRPRTVLHAADAQAAQAAQMLAATLANIGPFTVANAGGAPAPAPSLTCGTCNGTTVSFDAVESSVRVLLGVISCPFWQRSPAAQNRARNNSS
ncbi:hypothetical protein [Paraburkholderia sp.]|uniref:hypothetical protein n=1 Tax=Paraburkholderia sp. TaxID=1926495 RepID=UPI002F428362